MQGSIQRGSIPIILGETTCFVNLLTNGFLAMDDLGGLYRQAVPTIGPPVGVWGSARVLFMASVPTLMGCYRGIIVLLVLRHHDLVLHHHDLRHLVLRHLVLRHGAVAASFFEWRWRQSPVCRLGDLLRHLH